jgi:Family of unknown function (DUF5996)
MARVRDPRWPALPVAEWQATRDTLQLWTQIVGKVRLANDPLANHWWNVPLYVTARGLTTSLMPHASGRSFQIDFDFQQHRLDVVTVTGESGSIALEPGPVASFYAAVMGLLNELGVATRIWPVPVEIEGAIPFPQDDVHTAYDAEQARRFWLALVQIQRTFKVFRGRFVGKVSPIHLFWGVWGSQTQFGGLTCESVPDSGGCQAAGHERVVGVPAAAPGAADVDPARPRRRRQGHRDPSAASSGRGATPTGTPSQA